MVGNPVFIQWAGVNRCPLKEEGVAGWSVLWGAGAVHVGVGDGVDGLDVAPQDVGCRQDVPDA